MNRNRCFGSRCAWQAMALAALLVTSAGCAEPGLEHFQGEIVQLRDQVAADQALWHARFVALPEGDAARPLVKARLERTAAQRADAQAAIAQTEPGRDESQQPTDPTGSLVGAVAPWLPEPARTPLLLGSALVLTTARARQLKKGAASIAASLQRVMADDPQLAEKLRQHAGTLRAIQTPTAARIVDEADTQRTLIRLPI